MSPEARILFEQINQGVEEWIRYTGSAVRKVVDTSKLPVEQQRQLQEAIRESLEGLVSYVLGRFDNVGCTLPPGIWG